MSYNIERMAEELQTNKEIRTFFQASNCTHFFSIKSDGSYRVKPSVELDVLGILKNHPEDVGQLRTDNLLLTWTRNYSILGTPTGVSGLIVCMPETQKEVQL